MSHMDRIEHDQWTAPDISELNRYWNDPAYKARVDREHAHALRLHFEQWDRAQIAADNRWPHHWTDEEKAEMSAKLLAEYDPCCPDCGEPLDDNYQCPPCELAHDLAIWKQK